ncbi:centromere protein F [Chanos chanos]|uniref:Centromere protein F n=1 Tax=Chanos chanos TaxID=29144 RepID=A0A6J2UQI5_CHACN|nr:centromere protein F-like [Chanos chanos]
MSWAADDWTSGLSGHVLQKVQELQAQQERLNREKQQKQLQLDNVEAALHKQKLKNEELRVDLVAVQRELVAVQEQAQGEVRARERLTQELQMKQAQVCGLEGQLDSARTLTQTLTQEIKRLEAELEKLQKGNGSGDSVLFSTPCWNMTSPWDNGSRPDERPGLRGDGDMKAHSVRQLQFGDLSPKSSVGSTSSPLPQQPHKTPPLTRHVRQSETPSGVFPWERDNSVSAPKGRVTSSGPSCNVIVRGSDSGDYGMEEALRKERDTVQELRKWAESLEGELRAEKQRCKECEARLAEVKREVNTKEQSLTRSRDELSRAQTRIAQEGDRAEAAEQRVKQLQEELKCQRQNAETSRCNAEQRRKEMEREHNKELLELQKERQASERQHQQESNKLNQEIQQARAQHNTLQSQYDKLSLQKQAVERDLETAKGKLKGVETDLSETRKREAQTQAKLTEAQRENEGLSVRLEQLKKKEKNLEEEVKRLTEELAEALRLIKELQDKLAASAAAAAAAPLHATAAAESFCPAVTIIQERSPPHRPCTQRKKLHKTERAREEGQERMKYPSNREPGEGIDSEHIAEFGSEDSKDQKIRGNKKSQCEPGRQSETDMETSLTEQDTGIEDTDTESYMSDSTSDTAHKPDGDYICGSRTGGDQDSSKNISSHPGSGQKNNSSSPDNLKRENTALRDELQDVKQELQRRLDDLETQRRAEAEARTKLKQLSRKHSNQAEQHRTKAQELREAAGKLEAQLEEERKEGGKLRQTLALLEKELQTLKEEKERIKERDDENEEKERSRLEQALADMERKQLEMEEESGQLKRDLEALQSELAQVREEREKERDLERKQPQKEELKAELDLRAKIQELQAELDKLRESSHSKEKDLKDNAPLTYLQLGDLDTKNNATVISEGIIPSPDAHMAFCESVNQQNAIVSQEVMTSDLITDFTEYAGKITHSVSSVEDKEGSPPNIKTLSDLDKTAFLLKELERVRMEKEGEAEAARNTQKKLEALQKQVTSQTKQLTQAFESQTKHIQNLLTELQERESALLKQNKELDLCREEIASLKAEKQLWQKELNVTASVNPEQSVDVSESM